MALTGCGPGDPEGIRTATVLNAYVRARQAKAVRQALCHGLTLVGVLIALTAPRLSTGTIVMAATIFAATAGWAILVDWSAARRLARLMDLHDSPDLRR